MPKTNIDYSNTIIYKITCNDKNIKEVYVGHTTNFVQRKHAHKQSCNSNKSINHSCKVYQVIRDNGGWDNWKMEIINFFNCKDHYEARKKEQEYFISLNATLNSIEPMPKPKIIVPLIKKKEKNIFFCSICNIYCNSSNRLEEHKNTKKHLKKEVNKITKENNSYNKIQKESGQFNCDKCNFICSKKSNYDKHIHTRKHINNYSELQKDYIKISKKYICICGKDYIHRQGLYTHKKMCMYDKEKNIIINPIEEIKTLNTLVMVLIKSNTNLQKQLVQVCKKFII